MKTCRHCGGEAPLAHPKPKQCARCGVSFLYREATGRRASARYCSDRCRNLAWQEQRP